MLYISIESEIEARKTISNDSYYTTFVVDYGYDPICMDIINAYPFENEVIVRPFKHMGWGNILEGFKHVFGGDCTYSINIEDDCLLHSSFFKYVNKAQALLKNERISVINTSRRSVVDSDPVTISRTNLFEAPACVIYKEFFNKYVRKYASQDYYTNRAGVIDVVNSFNPDDERSKYRKSLGNQYSHVGWDGLVNRLIDTAYINEGMFSVSNFCDRNIHIGFYGANRQGSFPSGGSVDFYDRVEILRKIIISKESMQQYDSVYFDYTTFSPLLDTWDGSLEFV
jgi:hypothetical protein